jgi:hypothetical protein
MTRLDPVIEIEIGPVFHTLTCQKVEAVEAFDGRELRVLDAPLDHPALPLDQLQFRQPQQVADLIDSIARALPDQLVILAQAGRQLQRFQVIGEQDLRRALKGGEHHLAFASGCVQPGSRGWHSSCRRSAGQSSTIAGGIRFRTCGQGDLGCDLPSLNAHSQSTAAPHLICSPPILPRPKRAEICNGASAIEGAQPVAVPREQCSLHDEA